MSQKEKEVGGSSASQASVVRLSRRRASRPSSASVQVVDSSAYSVFPPCVVNGHKFVSAASEYKKETGGRDYYQIWVCEKCGESREIKVVDSEGGDAE